MYICIHTFVRDVRNKAIIRRYTINAYIYIYIYTHVYVYICVYIYICICIYTYIYTYIFIYVFKAITRRHTTVHDMYTNIYVY